ETGTAAVKLAAERLTIDRVLTPKAFDNALRVLLAIGGSTNAIVHLAAIAGRLGHRIDLDALTVTGETLGERIEASGSGFEQDVVRPFARPIYPQGGLAVLRGNLAPGGAIIKQSAADPRLMEHEGRAVVFESIEDLVARIDDEALDVSADDVLVLKRIGP
ncbi:dihydroxy-acid dehydratase, partial [Burkholderia vietnamiensis]|uniref:dihydroxy-acid dehydratase domain-containing protein n=1 Tax=Burkholderia vietnamiensis TaxID=60552 RepID=UPI00158FD711